MDFGSGAYDLETKAGQSGDASVEEMSYWHRRRIAVTAQPFGQEDDSSRSDPSTWRQLCTRFLHEVDRGCYSANAKLAVFSCG
jgi:hypothetical protein